MDQKKRMYKNAKTWNPFKGCSFGCIYCIPSFQQQAKRQKQRCLKCYDYIPHYHPERLDRIPSAEIIFVCGNGDISLCHPEFTFKIIKAVKGHNKRCPYKNYYFQSKRPEYFDDFLSEFPINVILITTLETNRDEGYTMISKAPKPSIRYQQFLNLDYPRKVVTIEPVMDFDVDIFAKWIIDLNPMYVYLGFNSRPKQVQLPELSESKVKELISVLTEAGIQIKPKDLRGMKVDIPTDE